MKIITDDIPYQSILPHNGSAYFPNMKTTFNPIYIERKRFNHIYPLISAKRKYLLFPNDNAVTTSLIDGWIYEPYMFRFITDNLLKLDGTTILDIGANNGHFAVEFANYVGDTGKVHAFEPQRIIFQQLCGNIFINGLDNVYCYNMAVGDTTGTVRIQRPDYFDKHNVNFGDVSITEDYSSSEEVQLVKLDDFKFDNVSIIKIDVQGFEPKVITGAINTINTHRPFIFIEIESPQLKKFNYTESELITQIESLDYIVTQFQIGIIYQSPTGNCLDYVCIPKEKYEIQNFIIT